MHVLIPLIGLIAVGLLVYYIYILMEGDKK